MNRHLPYDASSDLVENLMLIYRGWSSYVDRLRDDIWTNHSKINIIDFDFYNTEVFNRCENSNDILTAVKHLNLLYFNSCTILLI